MSQEDLPYRIFELLVELSPNDDICDLVWSAITGDEALDAAIDGKPSERPARAEREAVPAGAFLTSLAVEGFRGIGSKAMINFRPGPGLVIVAGRNGSGKSSLAEGFEYALTNTTYRWKLGTRFMERWRNLHHPEPCKITVELAQEDVGRSTVVASWPAGSSLVSDGQVTYQPHGQPRRDGLDELGWTTALETYRPILSYEELGRLLSEKDAQLHDSLRLMLGLDALTEADRRLKALLDPIKQPLAIADRERKELRARAEASDDERAQRAGGLLRRTRPEVLKLRALITGASDTTPTLRALREISGIELPSAEQVELAATRLIDALAAEREIGDRTSDLDDRRRSLLEQALHFAEAAGEDVPCPICQQGTLDGDWRTRATNLLAESDLLDQHRRAVQTGLDQARRKAVGLIAAPPNVLGQGIVQLESQAQAARAWMAWGSLPADDRALVEHLRSSYQPLLSAVATWKNDAASAEAQQEATWQPLAVAISGWLGRYQQALTDDQLRARLDTARRTLVEVEKTVRKERMAPIVDHARQIWSRLRQESSVDLGDIDLTGQNMRRGVEITASVDGAEAGALAVMSQGELQALALAIFLPRAALSESPFRFIILDDPVQAMDPAKVDGLAQVLNDLAQTRQVIVLSHDDRLAQAARRLPKPPRILEVTRSAGSHVRVHESHSPTRRYVEDARALCNDSGLPEATRREILPGVLRQALEAACYDRYYTDWLRKAPTSAMWRPDAAEAISDVERTIRSIESGAG